MISVVVIFFDHNVSLYAVKGFSVSKNTTKNYRILEKSLEKAATLCYNHFVE